MKAKYNLLVYYGDKFISFTLSRWTTKGTTSVAITESLANHILAEYEYKLFKSEDHYTIYSVDIK